LKDLAIRQVPRETEALQILEAFECIGHVSHRRSGDHEFIEVPCEDREVVAALIVASSNRGQNSELGRSKLIEQARSSSANARRRFSFVSG
jgi:hypothetical protein